MSLKRWVPDGEKISGDDWNRLADLVEFFTVQSDPPDGKYKVTGLYVEIEDGEPKLRVEFEVVE